MHQIVEFFGLRAPHGMWMALGAAEILCAGQLDFGAGSRGERSAAYVVELLERARLALPDDADDRRIVATAIRMYGDDRMSRSVSALGSALGSLARTASADRALSAIEELSRALVALATATDRDK